MGMIDENPSERIRARIRDLVEKDAECNGELGEILTELLDYAAMGWDQADDLSRNRIPELEGQIKTLQGQIKLLRVKLNGKRGQL